MGRSVGRDPPFGLTGTLTAHGWVWTLAGRGGWGPTCVCLWRVIGTFQMSAGGRGLAGEWRWIPDSHSTPHVYIPPTHARHISRLCATLPYCVLRSEGTYLTYANGMRRAWRV